MLVTNELLDFAREWLVNALEGAMSHYDAGDSLTGAALRREAAEWATILNVLEQQVPAADDEPQPRQCL